MEKVKKVDLSDPDRNGKFACLENETSALVLIIRSSILFSILELSESRHFVTRTIPIRPISCLRAFWELEVAKALFFLAECMSSLSSLVLNVIFRVQMLRRSVPHRLYSDLVDFGRLFRKFMKHFWSKTSLSLKI